MQKDLVRVDMHVHVDGKTNKENVINSLKKAEKDKVKKLCLLEHSHLDILTPILEILKEGSLRKYYSGELFVGCEYDNIIDAHHTNNDGSNYDNFVSHILVYTSLEDSIKLFNNKVLHARDKEKDYKKDYKKLLKRIMQLNGIDNLEIPTLKDLKSMNTSHIVRDLQAWITQNPQRRNAYKTALNATPRIMDYPSDFIRNLAQDPQGPLFYKPTYAPYTSVLFKTIRKEAKSAKIILAHPAYMHAKFKTQYYLDTMIGFAKQISKEPFDGIEVCYYFNTPEEQEFLENYANKHNFLKTAGSDSIKVDGEMYFIRNGEKYFFVPKLGTALGATFDLGKVEIKQEDDKKIIKILDDDSPLVAQKDLFEDIKIDEKEAYKMLNNK